MPKKPNYLTFPPNLRHGIRRYIEEGISPGGFLAAVISNNLSDSFAQADEPNRFNMFSIVKWMYNQAPRACWGSKEIMLWWIESRKEQREEKGGDL